MNSTLQQQRLVRWFFTAQAIIGVLASASIFLIPADPKNQIFLGLSAARLALLGLMLLLDTALVIYSVSLWRSADRAQTVYRWTVENRTGRRIVLGGGLAVSIAGWVFFCLPAYRWGDLLAYAVRFQPLAAWVFAFGVCAFLAALVLPYGLLAGGLRQALRDRKSALVWAGVFLALMLAAWAVIAITGLGFNLKEDFWFEAGIPILILQLAGSALCGLLVYVIERRSPQNRPGRSWMVDLAIFLALWALAAFLWNAAPIQQTYFNYGPVAPTGHFQTAEDSVYYDNQAQAALIGEGLNYNQFLDRPLYPWLLIWLHVFTGQQYEHMIFMQTILLALLPAGLYFLGKKLHSRGAGIAAGLICIFQVLNCTGIANLVTTTTSHQLMTELPAAFLLTYAALLLLIASKMERKGWPFAVLAGGLLGLGTLLRPNILIVALCVLAGYLLFSIKNIKKAALLSALIALGMFLGILPWGLKCVSLGASNIFAMYTTKMQQVQITRYEEPPASITPPPSESTDVEEMPFSPEPTSDQVLPAAIPSPTPALNVANAGNPPGSVFLDKIRFIADHFLHNLVSTVMSFPTSLQMDDLQQTVRGTAPYWWYFWDGALLPGAGILIFVNLAFLALGMATAYRRGGVSGLIPAFMFVGYHLSNGIARTSGGRYMVNVNWVAFLYYAIGLIELAAILLTLFRRFPTGDPAIAQESGAQPSARRTAAGVGLAAVGVFIAGGLMPFTDNIFPEIYPDKTNAELINEMAGRGYLDGGEITQEQIGEFLSQPGAVLLEGRLLYPVFQEDWQCPLNPTIPYSIAGFPRFYFNVLTNRASMITMLPYSDTLEGIREGEDVIVLGCLTKENYVDALALWLPEDDALLLREPSAALQCPAPLPVPASETLCP